MVIECSSVLAEVRWPARTQGHRIEDRVAIQNGVAIRSRLRKGFSQLLYDPIGGRMPGNVEVRDPTAPVLDDEQTVQHSEGRGRHSEGTEQGWMHSSAAGGDYFLFVRFEPTVPGYRKSPINGNAFLCAAQGEKFRLHFGEGMPRGHGTDLRGVPIHLYFYSWTGLQLPPDRRPSFDLYGTFGDSELNMEDRGSLASAFRSDGTLYGPRDHRSGKPENSRFTLKEGGTRFSAAGARRDCVATTRTRARSYATGESVVRLFVNIRKMEPGMNA